MKVNEIKDLVNSLSQTHYRYINVKHEGTELTLSDEPISMPIVPLNQFDNTTKQPTVEPNTKEVDSEIVTKSGGEIIDKNENLDSSELTNEDYFIVKSPLVGTFYNAPSPDADPYVKVGDSVEVGDTLCIIEAMKLMNNITAEVKGKIVEVLVSNEEGIEYGHELFKIKAV